MPDRPNILLLFTDQQRADTIGALGNEVIKTPAMDRIANRGVAFTSAYTPSPVCVPARCSMHYGQYATKTGCFGNATGMPNDRPSMADALTNAGYRTHSVGKCHFVPDKHALRGFQTREIQEEVPARDSDDYTHCLEENGWGELPEPHGVRGEMYYIPQVNQLPPKYHPTQWVGDRSVAFIEEQKDSEQPWMLFSSYIHPHPPFAPPWPWHKLYRSFDLPYPKVPVNSEDLHTFINKKQNRYKYRDQGIDKQLARNIIAHYYACISFVDYQVGRILDQLEATGQMDNTLILFSSDHGELLGDYNCYGKRSMHDAASRVPMLAALPGVFEGGQRCDRLTNLVDFMPTMLEAAGVDTADLDLDGVGLAGVLADHTDREQVHSQWFQDDEAIFTTITDQWKYAWSAPDQREFLFDRVNDPDETRDCAADHPDVLAKMRARTIEWVKGDGITSAYEGDTWKLYPRKQMPDDPNAGLITQDRPGYTLDLPGYAGKP